MRSSRYQVIWHACLFTLTAATAVLALASVVYVTLLALVGSLAKKPANLPFVRPQTRFVVLIPAHNEEHGIVPTLESMQLQNYPAELFRTIVIADNCGDRTADAVRAKSFECWERSAPDAPGKGHALRWALARLASAG